MRGLDFSEDALEPSEGRGITADPEEFDALQGPKAILALAIIDILQDRREGGDACAALRNHPHKIRSQTDTRPNQNSDLVVEHVLRRGAERPVNPDRREVCVNRKVEFSKSTTRHLALLLVGFRIGASHCLRRHPSDDVWARAEALTQGMRKIAHLADV